jgi:hypothetical protein
MLVLSDIVSIEASGFLIGRNAQLRLNKHKHFWLRVVSAKWVGDQGFGIFNWRSWILKFSSMLTAEIRGRLTQLTAD